MAHAVGTPAAHQDHRWMRAFGESLVAYRPPIDTRSVSEMRQIPPNGFPEKALTSYAAPEMGH
ncbi:hypothetical protein ACVXHB_05875 [Escherichia coli]